MAVETSGAGAVDSPTAPDENVVTRVRQGRLRGDSEQGALVFRGVPYASPPVGPLRFAAPRPPEPWSGTRRATEFGPPFVQPIMPGSEDALYANVWTPGLGGRRPVFVYIHGGEWRLNTATDPTYDGARLAVRGQMVVVTFNYRLGPFGFGLHEQLADSTGGCSNWGLQDQAALIEWVRDNIAAFGGDPDNITVCGTSAGGSSAWQLARLPHLRPTIRRIIPISAGHIWSPPYTLEPEDSRTAFEEVAAQLGVTVAGLRDLPAEEVSRAWEGCFEGPPERRVVGSGRIYRGPVVDGHTVFGFDASDPVPDVPIMAINTHTEGSFFTRFTAPSPQDDHELAGMVGSLLRLASDGVGRDLVDDVVEHYRAAARRRGEPTDPLSLYTEIYGDSLLRHQIVRLAERAAAENDSAVYHMDFAFPARAPHFGTPHEATAPFLFGTCAVAGNAEVFGDGPRQRLVSDIFVDLVSSFAHRDVPSSSLAPRWPGFSPHRESTMLLGGDDPARVTAVPKYEVLRFWDRIGWGPPRP
ncbi:carboxylesterase/lipase family protein [Actinopolyspora mortivallis]|uniref:carboxylesterase/lipase family protein n=1 Tax=Actinopolyspora mortivallis TaxID=33906 RepID=UPI0012ECD106|nr:carboxylesterase family protein [Actinopolyspora mortivallis]